MLNRVVKNCINSLNTKLHKRIANMYDIRKNSTFDPNKTSEKIFFPAAQRNQPYILEVLEKHFHKDTSGNVLEVSSGTGQHISYFASNFPNLTFQPSEYDTSMFKSIAEYARDTPTKNVNEPIFIDASLTFWDVQTGFDYMININMIHVSPFSCTIGLFTNAGKLLKPRGLLVTYGAYAHNGVLEPQSNIDFDRSIRSRHPDWGVRDISDLKEVAKEHGIKLLHIYDLPANNKCLVWQKM